MNEKKQSSEILWQAIVVGSINGWLDTDTIMTQMIDLVYKYAKSYYNILYYIFSRRHMKHLLYLSTDMEEIENI